MYFNDQYTYCNEILQHSKNYVLFNFIYLYQLLMLLNYFTVQLFSSLNSEFRASLLIIYMVFTKFQKDLQRELNVLQYITVSFIQIIDVYLIFFLYFFK